jgi:hypothetical protein
MEDEFMTQTMDSQELAIVPQERGGLISLVGNIEQIKLARKTFEDLKQAILVDSDFQTYTERNVTRRFIKKSGWRNIGMAFGISLEPVSSEFRDLNVIAEGRFAIEYRVKATAPNGRYVEGVGSCDSHEDRFAEKVYNPGSGRKEATGRFAFEYNDVASTAYTRAANRAISDLVGGGEVSAEEISKISQEPEQLSKKLQDRLFQLADQSPEHYARLARMVLDIIGVKYLTTEQATTIGKALAAFKSEPLPAAQVVTATATELTPEPDDDEPPLFPEDEPAPIKPVRLSQPAQDFITKIQQAPHLDALKTLTLEMSRAGFKKGHPEYGALTFAYQQAEAKIREILRNEASGK